MATQTATQSSELSLLSAIEMVAKDKGIDKSRLIKTVEEAILKAAQSVFGPNRELEARFNEDTGQVDLFQYMTVVDDPSDDEREISLERRGGTEDRGLGEVVADDLQTDGHAALAGGDGRKVRGRPAQAPRRGHRI